MALRRRPPTYVPEVVNVALGYLSIDYAQLVSLDQLLRTQAHRVVLKADNRILSQISDIYSATRGEKRGLQIDTDGPQTTIYLTSAVARIEVPDGSDAGMKLAASVRELLRPCRRRTPVGAGVLLFYFSVVMIFNAALLAVSSMFDDQKAGMELAAWSGGAGLFGGAAVLVLGRLSGAARLKLGRPPDGHTKSVLKRARLLPENVLMFPVGHVRLFPDDIEDVVRVLQERSRSVSLEAGDAHLDTATDLKNAAPDELAQVEITSTEPHILVDLRKNQAFVFALDKTDEAAVTLANDVHRMLRRRRTWIPTGISLWIVPFVSVMAAGFVASAPIAIMSKANLYYRLSFPVLAVCAVFYAVSVEKGVRFRGSAKIYPVERSQRTDLVRSWTQVALSIVIGAAVSAAVTWWQLHDK
ncbi:MAG TPA: hypothetical protein VFC19_39200 [Candidatus Limnocylindrales bacterium]|nr:hypothetical protein [Candidatus Limnocylindrales bacterium]